MGTTTFSGNYGEVAYITISSPIAVTAKSGFSIPVSFQARGYDPSQPSTLARRFRVTLKIGSNSSGNLLTNNVSSNSANATGSYTFTAMSPSIAFTSANPTARTATLNLTGQDVYIDYSPGSGPSTPFLGSAQTVAEISLTLDAPPTYTLSALSTDTAYVYTGLTTASVTVSNLSAKYGGNITDVTLTIGNQSVSRSDNGVLSILLANVGTFTPTVTVTDSRGQTTTKTLDPITVNGYVAPSVSFTADRTLASGVPDDEGTYGTVDATFTFTDVVADAVAPSVVLTDENGTQTTPTVTWYSTRASDGTLSGSVTWSMLSSGDTVYGLIPNLNTQYSYQISIRPRDSEGTGTAITQTLSSAFYTVDFLAGGHGIAFGQPASQDGFFCNMDAHFADKADVMRALFDFIHPVGSYYETSDTSFNPNTTWGGTWELEIEGQVHVSSGTNYLVSGALTNTSDGGSADAIVPYHNHSVSAVGGAITGGSHSHTLDGNASSVAKGSNYVRPRSAGQATADQYYTTSNTHTHDLPAHNTNYAGTNGAEVGANMPPHINVNRWHRTA